MPKTLKRTSTKKIRPSKKGGSLTDVFNPSERSSMKEYNVQQCSINKVPLFVEILSILLKCDISKLNNFLRSLMPHFIHKVGSQTVNPDMTTQGVDEISVSSATVTNDPVPILQYSNKGATIDVELSLTITVVINKVGLSVPRSIDITVRVRIDISFMPPVDVINSPFDYYTPAIKVSITKLVQEIKEHTMASTAFNFFGADKQIKSAIEQQIRSIPSVVTSGLGQIDFSKYPFLKKSFFENILYPGFSEPSFSSVS